MYLSIYNPEDTPRIHTHLTYVYCIKPRTIHVNTTPRSAGNVGYIIYDDVRGDASV